MTAIRVACLLLLVLAGAGCRYFNRVPITSALPSGESLKLSHTQVCVGDSDPIELKVEPATRLEWSLIDAKEQTVRTGELLGDFRLDVGALPVMRYKVVVRLKNEQTLEAPFEISHCFFL